MITILIILILYSTFISCEKEVILSDDKKELSDSLIRPLGNLGFGADSSLYKISCYNKLPERKDSTFVINNYKDYEAFLIAYIRDPKVKEGTPCNALNKRWRIRISLAFVVKYSGIIK